jgi:pantetheine-phosphate adenylyltransferase
MKRALYPGSFDPITIGHQSLVKRALPLFDEIVIGIGTNSSKSYFFTLDERIERIKQAFKNDKKVVIKTYTGLTVDFCKEIQASYILRGLRTSADFEFERTIALMNQKMTPEVETVFMLSLPEYSAINSTVVRDIIRNNGDATAFLPQ